MKDNVGLQRLRTLWGKNDGLREEEDWLLKSIICKRKWACESTPTRIEACLVKHFAERDLIEEVADPW
jgi:hypothetical protein